MYILVMIKSVKTIDNVSGCRGTPCFFQETPQGAGFKTGDFVKLRDGEATVERRHHDKKKKSPTFVFWVAMEVLTTPSNDDVGLERVPACREIRPGAGTVIGDFVT